MAKISDVVKLKSGYAGEKDNEDPNPTKDRSR
jgi:hypothetical protein